MIVSATEDALLLVEQEHHAHLTGELAALLPRGRGDHAALLAAARVHDNGWREADQAPTIDQAGWPHTFATIDDDAYEAVWRRGIARVAEVDALVGLLVGLHGARFFGVRSSPGMRDLAQAERARQDRVLAELGLGGSWEELPGEVAEPSDRIALLDAVSLMLCGAFADAITASVGDQRYTLTPGPGAGALPTVVVRPWPFVVAPPPLAVTARRLPRAPLASSAALQEAVAAAEPITVRVALA